MGAPYFSRGPDPLRRALEDEDLLGFGGDGGEELHPGGAIPDDRNPLSFQVDFG